MEQRLFTNQHILAWLQYFAQNTEVDLEKVKLLDITRKNKNLIPTIEANQVVLVFTDDNRPDIFYKMWDVGLGECEVWYNEGSDPSGPIKHDKLKDMINRGINASAGMLIYNPNARTTYKIGMDNSNFSKGSIHYVGSEVRAVILNKLHVGTQDTVCIVNGESVAVEVALIANEGTVIAVEYDRRSRETMESNIQHFGLNNINIIDHVDTATMATQPIPSLAFLVASASLEQELECLIQINPAIELVVYTLDFGVMAKLPALLDRLGVRDVEMVQVSVSRLTPKNLFQAEPAPWIVSGKAMGTCQ